MTHQIKFKAWHKEYKKMYEVKSIEWINESDGEIGFITLWPMSVDVNSCTLDDVELMQWTGLVIDGNHIYVGDLLEYDSCKLKPEWAKERHVFEVKWAPSEYMFALQNIKTKGYSGLAESENMILIGNIYMNPDMLNASRQEAPDIYNCNNDMEDK